MTSCIHMNFVADVRVGRLTSEEGGPVTGYTADVRIQCAECSMPFTFRGMATGSSPNRPMVSVGGEEARLPIEPSEVTALSAASVAGRA